jgi:methionyl-tRNA formyltransferase
MVNVHFSLLPRWRGAAPVERSILAGDSTTGVCVMRLEPTLDTGALLSCREVVIGEDETAPELAARLGRLGADVLLTTLSAGPSSLPPGEPQRGEPSYAAKLEPGELKIDWSRRSVELARLVRLGRAWTTFRGRRLAILRARVGSGREGIATEPAPPGTILPDGSVAAGLGVLEIEDVRPAGKPTMVFADWRRGARVRPGERFGGVDWTSSPGKSGKPEGGR